MFHLRNWNRKVSLAKWHETFNRVIQLINEKRLNLMRIDSQHYLLDIKTALEVIENAKTIKGKVFRLISQYQTVCTNQARRDF